MSPGPAAPSSSAESPAPTAPAGATPIFAAALFDPNILAAVAPIFPDPADLENTLVAREEVLADKLPPPPPSRSDSPSPPAPSAEATLLPVLAELFLVPPPPPDASAKNSELPVEEGMRRFHPRPPEPGPLSCSALGDDPNPPVSAPRAGVAVVPAGAPPTSVSLVESEWDASSAGVRPDALEFQVATLAAAMGGAGVPLVTGPVFVGVALSCGCGCC